MYKLIISFVFLVAFGCGSSSSAFEIETDGGPNEFLDADGSNDFNDSNSGDDTDDTDSDIDTDVDSDSTGDTDADSDSDSDNDTDSDSDSDGDTDSDNDTDVDSDSDTDTDVDTDSDTDTNMDTETNEDFICYDAYCVDSSTGLMWQNPMISILDPDYPDGWNMANSYCNSLFLGGFSGWRLPTILELRSIVRGCLETEIGGSCEIVDGCAGEVCVPCTECNLLWLMGPGDEGLFLPEGMTHADPVNQCSGYYMSSTTILGSVPDSCLDQGCVWGLSPCCGSININKKDSKNLVRCVRSL